MSARQVKITLIVLLSVTFILRLLMAFLDPFLHDWDERFHALVAKNMMDHPFKPMLRAVPLWSYDYTAWCCNHIWLHKQPLMLWQMALSMKIFGVHEWAVRLPSVLLGVAMCYWTYRIAKIWSGSDTTGLLACALSCFSFYQMQLTSGMQPIDHNDLVFTAYVTGSFWAFFEYTNRPGWKWTVWTGILSGLAILVKWLTGYLVIGSWGLFWLFNRSWWTLRNTLHLAGALLIATAVMAPWQVYIMRAFPKESAWEYAYNAKHLTENLGGETKATMFYYLEKWPSQYYYLLLPFMLAGIVLGLAHHKTRRISLVMLMTLLVVYGFFSVLVATKMISFTFIVCFIVYTFSAIGIEKLFKNIYQKYSSKQAHRDIVFFFSGVFVALLMYVGLKTPELYYKHGRSNPYWVAKRYNTQVYKKLDNELGLEPHIVINLKSFEDVDMMFYSKHNASHWWPDAGVLDSLIKAGYKVAAFPSHHDQNLPPYFATHSKIKLLEDVLK